MIDLRIKTSCSKCKKRGGVTAHVDLAKSPETIKYRCTCGVSNEIPPGEVAHEIENAWTQLKAGADGGADKVARLATHARELVADEDLHAEWVRRAGEDPQWAQTRGDLVRLAGAVPPPGQAGDEDNGFFDALGITPDLILKRLDELKEGLDAIRSRVEPVAESAALLGRHGDRLVELQALAQKTLHPKEKNSLYKHLERVAAGHEGSLRAAIEQHAGALAGAIGAVSDRQPVQVDAAAVGEKLLEFLADPDRARGLIAEATATYFRPRHQKLEGFLSGLPKLLDALARPVEVYGGERGRSAEGGAVREVLLKIKKNVDVWLDRHQIEEFPDLSDGPVDYNRGLHVSVASDPTADAALHGKVARVIVYGYRWQEGGDLIRKAEVALHGPPVAGGDRAGAGPNSNGDGSGFPPGTPAFPADTPGTDPATS